MKHNYNMVRWLTGIALLILCQSAMALQVTRGPYLQAGTQTSVIIKWSTDTSADSHVAYGTSPGNLDQTATVSGTRRQHEVPITGLTPGTKYFYSVGSSSQTLEGNDNNHYFKSALPKDASQPVRVWVIGDSGTANSSARAVRDAYLNFNGSRETDLILMLGDNAYNDGTDSEYQAAVFDMYPSLLRHTMLWSTLGNHDGHSANSASESGPYYNIFTFPRNGESGGLASGTEAYFSFDYGDIHFVNLDSYETNRSSNGAMMNWLEADLSTTDKKWIIAFFHHPPYSKGSHDSDSEGNLIDMRQNALPILESYGVDLVLSGHSHSYERSYLIDGHYGDSDTFSNSNIVDGGDGRESGNGAYEKATAGSAAFHEGSVYVVAGSSGKTSGGSLDHPAMYYSLNSLGSMVLDFEGNRLDAIFLDSNANVRDSFTILKGPSGPLPTAQPVINPVGGVFANSAEVSLSTTTEGASIYYTLNGADPGPGSTLYTQPFTVTETTTVKAIAIDSELGDSAIATSQITVIPAGSTLLQDSGSDGILSIEVEHHDANIAQGGHFWEETFPAGFSGSAAMIASENTGTNNNTGYVTNSPMMEYQVTFVKTGTHYIWVRGKGGSGSDDSVHVGLDGQAIATSDRIQLPSSLSWTEDTMDSPVATVEVDFPGLHTVNIWMREDGAVIDKLVMTTNANYSISGQGPAESPRGRPPVADAGNVYEGIVGSPVEFDGSGSSDEDGNSLTYNWEFGDGATGNGVSPSHTYDAAGSYTVSLVVNDGRQDSEPDTATATITLANQAPVAVPGGPYSSVVGLPVQFSGADSSDADGDALTYSWTFGDGASATGVSPSHAYDSAGDYTVQLTVNDGVADSTPVTTSARITVPNSPPIANDDSYTTDEDVNLNGFVISNDTDVDGDSLSIQSHTQPDHGSLAMNDDGRFTYSPNGDYHGADGFSYTVRDGNGATDMAAVSITVNPVNDAPSITSNAITGAQEGVLYSYDVQASDVDGDVLSYSLTTAPIGMTINSATGQVRWAPENGDVGSHAVRVRVVDGSEAGTTQTYNLLVSNSNDAPSAVNDTASVDEDDVVVIPVLDNDSDDDGDTLSVESSTNGSRGNVTINADGTLTYRPAEDVNGSDSFNYTITDGNGGTASAQVVVTIEPVNDAPVITSDAATGAQQGVLYNYDVQAADIDDGDVLTYSLPTAPDGMTIDSATGLIQWTPGSSDVGSHAVSVRVVDNANAGVVQNYVLVVSNTNEAPSIAGAPATMAAEDAFYSFTPTASDPDVGDTLTFGIVNKPSWADFNPVTGELSGTPVNEDVRVYSNIVISVTDGVATAILPAFNLMVVNMNDAPVAVGDSGSVNEDAVVTISVLVNDVDPDGDSLTVTGVTDPEHGSATIVQGGVDYSPNPDYHGADSFTYTIADSSGGVSSAEVAVTVVAVNDLPEILSEPVTTAVEGDPYEYAVIATDRDGETLSYSLDNAPGGMTINADTGLVQWLPGESDVGGHEVSIMVADGAGATVTQRFTLTVDRGAIIPQAVDDEVVAELNTPLTISVLDNDTYDQSGSLIVTIVTEPTRGSLVVNGDNTITYTPFTDVTDVDSFEYSITDSNGATSTATVTIENAGGAAMTHLLLLLLAALGYRTVARQFGPAQGGRPQKYGGGGAD